ncbi:MULTISPECIES: hypothetical protein [unclassified Halomonas]|uniref:hypothetical protein n=1 Tax=unclassified Halomonas TaxID=2609666 RepID=UPI0020769DF8|nr:MULTISPECIES: hypothetical protein [unclassified Halomonas]
MSTAMVIIAGFVTASWLLVFYWLYRWAFAIHQTGKRCRYTETSPTEIYKTSCGHEFYNAADDGCPVTDWLSFCPYCGKPAELKEDA